MTDSEMNIEKFNSLLNKYGSKFPKWPEEEAKPAQQFMNLDPEAYEVYTEFCEMERMFDKNKGKQPSQEIIDSVTRKIEGE